MPVSQKDLAAFQSRHCTAFLCCMRPVTVAGNAQDIDARLMLYFLLIPLIIAKMHDQVEISVIPREFYHSVHSSVSVAYH